MRIGLFFGSFNPIHIGHLIIANQVENLGKVDQIWFVISPENPQKSGRLQLNEGDRLKLVELAIQTNSIFLASDIEFDLPRPSFTIQTLKFLQEKHKNFSFSIIMGSDNFNQISSWKDGNMIRENFHFFVYERIGYPVTPEYNVSIISSPLLNISSTEIRKMIINEESIKYLVPEKVQAEIVSKKYYSKSEHPS